MKFRRLLVLVAAVTILNGCVTWKQVTVSNKTVTQSGMSLDLPVGWVSIKLNSNLNIVSKDGPSLNSIAIETSPFKTISKVLKVSVDNSLDMLEASKKFIAFWSKNRGITDFDIVKEDYVEIVGKGYFIVEWTFKDENGMTVRQISQGTVHGNNIVTITFAAPNIYYYGENVETVKEVFSSVRYTK